MPHFAHPTTSSLLTPPSALVANPAQECMGATARGLVECYHALFRCFIWCGCLCCSAAERRRRLDSYDRASKHGEERCMQGIFVRRTTCAGTCVVWVPKRLVDKLTFVSGVFAMIFLSGAGLAVLVGQLRVSSAVNKWTVVDSTSSDAYSAWQGNVEGASFNKHADGVGLAPPKTLKFYVWDVQNADDVLASAAKPGERERESPWSASNHRTTPRGPTAHHDAPRRTATHRDAPRSHHATTPSNPRACEPITPPLP